jgi:hypothetical protein
MSCKFSLASTVPGVGGNTGDRGDVGSPTGVGDVTGDVTGVGDVTGGRLFILGVLPLPG